MAEGKRIAGALPTTEHELLLRAAAASRGDAVAAWTTWTERYELDAVDHGGARLLPLVYRRIASFGVEDADLGRLKGLYRRSWYRNQILFRHAAAALAELEAAGLETMLFKGAALCGLHYRDDGVRPMDDVDILVRTERAQRAVEILVGAGWSPVTAVDGSLAVRHARELVGPEGTRIDLHWNALWQPAPDDDFWDASVETTLAGQRTRALCATDELLVVCVHGTTSSEARSIRWVADALAVLSTAPGGIDWQRLVEQARARRLTIAAADALAYLGEEFGASVPPSVMQELRATRTRLHERVGQRAMSSPPGPMTTLCVVWDRYRRLQELTTSLPRPRSFLAYATQTWGFARRRQLAAYAARRLTAHAVRRLSRGAPTAVRGGSRDRRP